MLKRDVIYWYLGVFNTFILIVSKIAISSKIVVKKFVKDSGRLEKCSYLCLVFRRSKIGLLGGQDNELS